MSCARDAHGDCCLASFHIGTMSIKPSDAGALRANLSKCMIGSVPNGESEWIVMKSRQPLFWILNQLVDRPRVVKVVTTQARR